MYKAATDALTAHFAPSKNTEYERFLFRDAKQNPGETMGAFHTRLQRMAKSCSFHDKNAEVKSQIIKGCLSTRIRRRALRETLSLKDLLDTARSYELAEYQASGMERHKIGQTSSMPAVNVDSQSVNKLSSQNKFRKKSSGNRNSKKSRECYFCGGIYPHTNVCPAKDKNCKYCNKTDHFEKCCHKRKRDTKSEQVRTVQSEIKTEQSHEPEHAVESDTSDEYLFAVRNSKAPACTVGIGDHSVKLLIDTGATINILSKKCYDNLSGLPNLNTDNLPCVFAYGADTNVNILGKFDTEIRCGGRTVTACFHVSDLSDDSLLGFTTSKELGIVQLSHISLIQGSRTSQIVEDYEDRFTGLGDLSDGPAKMHCEESASEERRHSRIPFMQRPKVEEELKKLLDNDVIEPCEGEPTPWVSLIRVVPKPKRPGEVCVCVDMRGPNKIIKREHHITPTMDDIIAELNGSAVYSKLDLNSGYHQISLAPESRKLTVFSTHIGLFRYKRLNFGVNSAAEIFQHKIRSTLWGLKGVINISDDILVHGKTQQEHDTNLEACLQRLREKNLTLNRSKCRFNKSRVEFYGHVFGAEGVSPDPKKITALRESDRPKNVEELRSFLGLAQYCSRFIGNFASIAEPLRKLTKMDATWTWKKKQEDSFNHIKDSIQNHCINSYFSTDPSLKTKLYVDASPVGLGAILAQETAAGELKIIALASRALSPTEQRYSQTEREALAITWGIIHFKLYLLGNMLVVITDH